MDDFARRIFRLRHLIHSVRTGYLRLQPRGVEPVFFPVLRVRVAFIDRIVLDSPFQQICSGHLIRGHQPHLGAHLHRHIRNGHALVHGQAADRPARILHRLVSRSRMADRSDRLQRNILRHNPLREFPVPFHPDRLRHLQPSLSGDENPQHLRGTHAAGERSQRAAHTGMRVGPQDYAARQYVAGLRHHLMAGARKFIIFLNSVFPGPVSRKFYDLRLPDAGGRRIMVGYNHHLVRVPDPVSQSLDLFRNLHPGTQNIVHHRPVNVRPDDLAGRNALPPGRPRQYFLRYRFSHLILLSGSYFPFSAKTALGTYTMPSMIFRAVR